MKDKSEIISAFQATPWFHELGPEHFNKLVNIANIKNVEAGEELFKEGDKEDCLYVIIEGRVTLEIYIPGRGRMRIYTAEPTDIVGWSSVTPVVRQRTAGARAVLPSKLICFNAADLYNLCNEDHDLGYVIMRRLSNVVASRLLTTRLQLLDMFAHPNSDKEVPNA